MPVTERVSSVTMRNFVGLEQADLEVHILTSKLCHNQFSENLGFPLSLLYNPQVRKAMLDFAYHLTIGNLDEAFKAIKLIKR